MAPDREERIEKMVTAIHEWIFTGNSAIPPATVRLDRLEGFKRVLCWIGGSFFTIVVLGGGLKLCFVLFGKPS
ncbi:hypothetical protein LCGC14_0416090 [marine sediment metagenome]|uniref:Uncharacterized protein n=1 Tax=marine sediment metagenome TaxID=412755 RepID=A0A0F9W1N1_9ZZZZ